MSQIVHKVSRVESRLNSLFQGGTCCSCCKCEPPKESTDSNDHVNNKPEGKSKLIEVVDCKCAFNCLCNETGLICFIFRQ